jgi:hypothetical protein
MHFLTISSVGFGPGDPTFAVIPRFRMPRAPVTAQAPHLVWLPV